MTVAAFLLLATAVLPPDEDLFRRAEDDRAQGRNEEAVKGYCELYTKYPKSPLADRARFLHAMGLKGVERNRALLGLDADGVSLEIRAAALYTLGSESGDPDLLARCVRLAPKGKYAPYANLKYGNLLNASDDPVVRRKGVEVLLGLAFGDGPLAAEALYLAAIQSYRDGKTGEADSLFRRYRGKHPHGEHFDEARAMSAWCAFSEGRFADAEALCGRGELDDLAYIRAACAYSRDDRGQAASLFRTYLADFPKGRYRTDAELAIARLAFDAARKDADGPCVAERMRLAEAYEAADKSAEAAAEYAQLARSVPNTDEAAEALFRKAMIDVRNGDWPAAERALTDAIAGGGLAGGRRATALYWCGIAAFRNGHEAEGGAFLEQAVGAGLGPDESCEARLLVADCDFKGGRVERAKAAYAALVRDGGCVWMPVERVVSFGKMLGGAEAEMCATALTTNAVPDYRQMGWAMLGAHSEKRGDPVAAIAAYRKCLAEPVKTADAAAVALRLGWLESAAGELDAADATLKNAIALNADGARARAEAYLQLARNAVKRGDKESARAYVSVLTSLFDDAEIRNEAEKIHNSL